MNEKMSTEDQAMIAEALRRMRTPHGSVPAPKVREFLDRLNDEWDRAGEMSEEKIRGMFQQLIAEASHVSS